MRETESWEKCPKCIVNDEKDYRLKLKAADDKYGHITAKEYKDLVASIPQPGGVVPAFRGVSSIEIISGMLEISFKGICNTCGFEFKYEKSIDMLKE